LTVGLAPSIANANANANANAGYVLTSRYYAQDIIKLKLNILQISRIIMLSRYVPHCALVTIENVARFTQPQ
jgi:hypothetical protein